MSAPTNSAPSAASAPPAVPGLDWAEVLDELDAHRAEVERLQMVLNQIERTALGANALRGDAVYMASARTHAFDQIAMMAHERHNAGILFQGREIVIDATGGAPHGAIARTVAEFKAASDRWQQKHGQALQEIDRLKGALSAIENAALVARHQNHSRCPEGRCQERVKALARIEGIACSALKDSIPF